jgi:formamidopyrimidine-DNA glycosylase
MPELPEVETVRRGLEPVLTGRVIARAQVNRPDLRWPLPERMAERLTGARVQALRRRSKYILAELDSAETLLIHLGMSGRMLISAPPHPPGPPLLDEERGEQPVPPLAPQGERGAGGVRGAALGVFHHAHPAPEKHDHVVLDLDTGARVTFNDARRFGAMDLMPTATADRHWLIADLGPEPLGNAFSAPYLAARLAGRRTPVKSALLDQRIVAGLGNIYVCEVLFRAGLHPARLAGDLSPSQVADLVPLIRSVLEEAIAAGGSSLRDYRQADGELGYFQHAFRVYDREGAHCVSPGCTGTVGRIVQSGRSSYFCPGCQR